MIPTPEQMAEIFKVIDSDLPHDEAVAKIVEITGWPEWQAAEVARRRANRGVRPRSHALIPSYRLTQSARAIKLPRR